MLVMIFTLMTFVLSMLSPFVMVSFPLTPPVMTPALAAIVIIVINGLNMDGARDINLTVIIMVTIIMMTPSKRYGYPGLGYKLIER